MLDHFALVAESNTARLFRCGLRDAHGIHTLSLAGVRRIYRLNPERLAGPVPAIPDQPVCVVRQIVIDPKSPDPLRVKQIVHMLRADMLHGVSLALCDASGREAVSLVVACWRLVFEHWSIIDAVREWNEFGAEWLSAETVTGIRECIVDIAEGIGTRRVACG